MSVGERLNLIREDFMVVPQRDKGGLQGHGHEHEYKSAMAGSLGNLQLCHGVERRGTVQKSTH